MDALQTHGNIVGGLDVPNSRHYRDQELSMMDDQWLTDTAFITWASCFSFTI